MSFSSSFSYRSKTAIACLNEVQKPTNTNLFLGFDCSTQSLKASVVDSSLKLVVAETVNFDSELGKYGTVGGVCRSLTSAGRVTVNPLLWVEALDLLLEKLKSSGFDFSQIQAISGSGQQHGSVFWKKGAEKSLNSLNPEFSLVNQLQSSFSTLSSPVWMDQSTSLQCQEIEGKLGGPLNVAEVTGSRLYERFTGPQIRKIFQDSPDVYRETERISLVSSFMASLLLGKYAPIDHSDGAGMNLMNIHKKIWWKEALEATSPDLETKLGPLASPHSVAGNVDSFFVEKYGFSPNCHVVVWSGDNPCSLAGLGLSDVGEIGLSLGTSDTVFGVVKTPQPGEFGHVFPNPVDPTSFMTMLCYQNGSLTRQEVRDRCANGSWENFDFLLGKTSPLNGGNMGFFFKDPEIQPAVSAGYHRFKVPLENNEDFKNYSKVSTFDDATEVRALIEGQIASMRGHCEELGMPFPPEKVIATGGGSASEAIISVVASVMNSEVYRTSQTDSASVGAALRAFHGWLCKNEGKFVPFSQVLKKGGPQSCLELNKVASQKSGMDLYKSFILWRKKLQDELVESS